MPRVFDRGDDHRDLRQGTEMADFHKRPVALGRSVTFSSSEFHMQSSENILIWGNSSQGSIVEPSAHVGICDNHESYNTLELDVHRSSRCEAGH